MCVCVYIYIRNIIEILVSHLKLKYIDFHLDSIIKNANVF